MDDQEHTTFSIATVAAASVVGVEVEEALDHPYVARVQVGVADPDFDPAIFLGQDAVLTWGRDLYSRNLCGLIRGVRATGREPDGSSFELELAPAFALLALTRNTRMFQERTAPEILETVLREKLSPYGRDVQLDLRAEYPRREYCVQYRESDLQFVQRLMEEEGISYSFDHQAAVELLVLRDHNDSYARVADAADPVPFRGQADVVTHEESVLRFGRAHDTTVTSVTLRDFDWSTPGFLVEDTAPGEGALGVVRESYEHGWGRSATIWDYDAGAARYQQRDAPRQKDVRLEAHRARAVVGRGLGRVVGFVPGGTFELIDHPSVGVDGVYLITKVRHLSVPSPTDTEAGGTQGVENYHNAFECIPIANPHRPRRTLEKPRVPSIQTAVVTGPSGEEIHTDEHGRIKVQFHWDRDNAADETSSCWVRVQQKWAGNGWGFFWLPRMGMEVVVQFFDGDPDRPLVTGAVYNAANPTPYELPADKTKSTIRSNSSPGGGGFNEWRFEDAAGQEQVHTHAQKDYNEVVENDHTTEVGHDQTIQVDNDQTQTVHANQTEDVGANQSLTVDGNRSVHVESSFDETVDGTETRTVSGAVDETFDANETRTVSGNLTETVGASETRTISGSQTESIGASHDVTISGSSTETVGAALSEDITGGITTTTAGSWTVTAAGGFNVTAAAGINLTMTGGLNLAAPGGVQQVDSWLTQIVGFSDWAGAFNIGGCILKDEMFKLHLAFTGIKTGGCVVAPTSRGFTLETQSFVFWKAGAELKAFGGQIHKWGVRSEN